MIRAYQHSCGGWYVARERSDGFHRQPPHCVCSGWGRCYDSADVALSVHRGDLDGSRPDGGDPNDSDD